MFIKEKLILQTLLNKASENVEATDTEQDTSDNTGDTSSVTEGKEVFTQDQVNKLVSKVRREVKNQYKDYEDLKGSVTKLQEKLDQLETTKKELETKYQETAFTSALEKAAKDLNLDTELASRLLDKSKVIFADEKPTNLVELLKVEIEKFPQLVKKQAVTPEVPTVTDTSKVKTFSLHKTSRTNFFTGGGSREFISPTE